MVLDVRGADLKASLPYGPDVVKPNLAKSVPRLCPGVVSSDGDPELK